jgi:hypothetical protein
MPEDSGTYINSDERAALDAARTLIEAGVPVFAAQPCPPNCPGVTDAKGKHTPHNGGPGKYHLPKHWEKTVPSPVNLEKWRPGWALAAVGGHAVDFLDVDPRNGGDTSLKQLQDLGQMPRVLAVARTPSGGIHYTITATGERKLSGFMPGLDLQSGAPGGEGRGFVWIAPTVRASKANQDAGTIKPYVWESPPDPEEIQEWAGAHDPSTEPIISRVRAKRSTPAQRDPVTRVDPDDPFMTASTSFSLDRSFSMEEAQGYVRDFLLKLRDAPIGMIEETCNVAATVLSHFVPNFWTVDQGMALLEDALTHTAYDPNGPSDWTVEKFRAVLDGTRPVQDPWTATRKPEPAAPPTQRVESAPGEEGLSTLEKLRRKLVDAETMALQPAPEPLVWGLLDLDTEAWMIGAPGSLKSFVALDIAGAVGAGREWRGHRTRQAKVLYVAAEGTRGMVLRTRAYIKIHGGMEGVTFLPYPVQVASNDGQWEALTTLAAELDPGLVVIDTQARVTVGLDENGAKDMGVLINAVGMLKRATQACVLVIHHTGRKGGDARGSSSIDGAQDTELKVVRTEPRSALECVVLQDKQKDQAEDREGVKIKMKVVDLGVDPVTERPLSSLVVSTDPYEVAQGHEVVHVDTTEWARADVEPWTHHVPGTANNSPWQKRILQTLADLAYTHGLTQAETRKAAEGKWGRPADAGTWTNAWKKVISAPIAANVAGERWALDQVALESLRAEHPA